MKTFMHHQTVSLIHYLSSKDLFDTSSIYTYKIIQEFQCLYLYKWTVLHCNPYHFFKSKLSWNKSVRKTVQNNLELIDRIITRIYLAENLTSKVGDIFYGKIFIATYLVQGLFFQITKAKKISIFQLPIATPLLVRQG